MTPQMVFNSVGIETIHIADNECVSDRGYTGSRQVVRILWFFKKRRRFYYS